MIHSNCQKYLDDFRTIYCRLIFFYNDDHDDDEDDYEDDDEDDDDNDDDNLGMHNLTVLFPQSTKAQEIWTGYMFAMSCACVSR